MYPMLVPLTSTLNLTGWFGAASVLEARMLESVICPAPGARVE